LKSGCIISILIFGSFFVNNPYAQSVTNKNISGTYASLWAETVWTFNFKSNNTYTYSTRGHFGNGTTLGKYKIKKDTVFLTAFPNQKQKDKNGYAKSDTLLIESVQCLIMFPSGYECLFIKNKKEPIENSKRRNLNVPGRPVIG